MRTKLVFLLCALSVCVQGSYLVQLRVTSYTNPSNRCAECNADSPLQAPFGCCDDFYELESCEDEVRCDNYFRYCLRPYATPAETLGCTIGGVITSSRPTLGNFDRDTDFSGSHVLGLDNPLTIQGAGGQWQGIQIYIISNDYDQEGSDEVIDMFAIDIPQSVVPESPESSEMEVLGRFGFARIKLRYRVMCQQFYYGNFCENFNGCLAWQVQCQNNGECIDQENTFLCQCQPGFSGEFCQKVDYCYNISCSSQGQCQEVSNSSNCECDPGYTGQLCEININECIGVNCSESGQCLDGLNSFTCICDPGFTGVLCESQLQLPLTIDANLTAEELSIPVLAGATAGGLTILILIVTASVLVACVLHQQQGRKREEASNLHVNDYHAFGKDNPVYGAPMSDGFSTGRTQTTTSPSTRASLLSQSELAGSNDQIYAEPTQSVTSYSRELSDEGHVFQNPLYQSKEDITNETENEVKVFSFLGSNGTYLSPLQQNECLI